MTTGGSGDAFSPTHPVADSGTTGGEIGTTRAEIEAALLRKKERSQDRLDVMSPVRERPLSSLGVALSVGILVGLFTGGDDDHRHARVDGADARAEVWEARARRLLRLAREQEMTIESPLHPRRDLVAERLTHFISRARAQAGTGA